MRQGHVLALVMVVTGTVAACDGSSTSADQGNGTMADSAEHVFFGVKSALTYAGVRRGELTADTMLSLDAATRFELRGVRTQFFTTLGRPLGTLTADTGTFWLNRALLEARGKVAIASDTNGRRIDGAWVRYDASKDQLESDSPFVATGRGRRLTGVGFTTDPGLFRVRCTKECSGSLTP